jgi:lysophospholipase L1-like esterase
MTVVRRVAILGSSISMVVRPREGQPYPRLLEHLLNDSGELWLVQNHSRVAATIDDVTAYLEEVVADQPDVVVFHYGHVEPILRPLRRKTWYGLWGVIVGESPRRARIRLLRQRAILTRNRIGLRRPWTPYVRYQRLLEDSLRYLRKETPARLFVLEANPGDAKIEGWGPGSLAAIRRYNEAAKAIADRVGARWFSLEELLSGGDVAELTPDGTHLSPEGHRLVAARLAAAVRDDR